MSISNRYIANIVATLKLEQVTDVYMLHVGQFFMLHRIIYTRTTTSTSNACFILLSAIVAQALLASRSRLRCIAWIACWLLLHALVGSALAAAEGGSPGACAGAEACVEEASEDDPVALLQAPVEAVGTSHGRRGHCKGENERCEPTSPLHFWKPSECCHGKWPHKKRSCKCVDDKYECFCCE
ncbi:unnamed protein product [Polarella glacialis]|uniref:Uncharacterized protein n=1 Tax=Polarella glacialis TaxID=89957 RepID=A0A813G3G1_POLGL|nr:unnamed protein product [Polarella glacialis]